MGRSVFVSLLVVGLSACAPVTAASHIKRAQAALARGDLAKASAEYDAAGEGMSVADAVSWGRNRIEVEKLRRAPVPSGTPAIEIDARRRSLRGLGGDAAIDRILVTALNNAAKREIADAEQQLASGARGNAVNNARHVRLPDVEPSILARVEAVQVAAAEVHLARAKAAGTGHPLVARAHTAQAVLYRLGKLPDGNDLAAPYRRSVTVIPTGCERFGPTVRDALASPAGPRHVDVVIAFTSCQATDDVSSSMQAVQWDEQVIDHYETKTSLLHSCHDEVQSVVTGTSSDCYTVTTDQLVKKICKPTTINVTLPVCTDVPTTTNEPVMRTDHHSDTREVTTRRWIIDVAGTWTIRHNEEILREPFSGKASGSLVTAPAIGRVAARSEGTDTTLDRMFAELSPVARISIELDRIFQRDVDAAIVRAHAAAGNIDDQEEAWLVVALLGGALDRGWDARYGTQDSTAQRWFNALDLAFTVSELPEPAATYNRSPEVADLTDYERAGLVTRVVPMLSSVFWFQGELAYASLGTATAPGFAKLGGDQSGLIGIRSGGRALTRAAKYSDKSPWGVRVVDEISGSALFGSSTGAPATIEAPTGAIELTVTYSLGLGYRRVGGGGLMAGIRPNAGLLHWQSGLGTYVTVPFFARVELPVRHSAVAVEAVGYALAGAARWGANLYIGQSRRFNSDSGPLGRAFTLRVERTTLDLDLNVPNPTPLPIGADNPTIFVKGVEATVVSLMYGVAL